MREYLRNASRTLRVALAVVLVLSLSGLVGCWGNSNNNTNTNDPTTSPGSQGALTALGEAPYGPYTAKDGTWAIYWYLCGSDIELRDDIRFTATGQMLEMLNVVLPDNVTVVIQTGGAQRWQNNYSDPNALTRFVYHSGELDVVDYVPLANMGEAETLADFLTFCNTYYPAEKQVLDIADHGGGSLGGIAYDALYGFDSLSLKEIELAMTARPAASGAYELVSFSACLMSSIDTIAVLNGLTRYYVASEEVQLGCFWDYEAFFGAIAKDTTIDGAALGRAIADGYLAISERVGYTAYTTFSVIDMSQADNLLAAYNSVGDELLLGAVDFGAEGLAYFGRAAYESENYGATNGPSSNVDMVDLGELVIKAQELLPNSSAAMLRAIDSAVIYHVINPLRAEGHGVSCYFPYTGNMIGFETFAQLNTSPGFVHFFEYALTGSLSQEGQAYLASLAEAAKEPEPELQPLPEPGELDLDGFPVVVYGNGTWCMELGEQADFLAAIYLHVCIYDSGKQELFLLGETGDLYADWELGFFRDEFSGYWGSIDGSVCYMEATSEGEDYILYRVPVWHNGVYRNLMVLYSWDPPYYYEGSYEILGLITQSGPEKHASNAQFEKIKVGDVLEPSFFRLTRDSGFGEDYITQPGNPHTRAITVTEDTRFYEVELRDGLYVINFLMIDYAAMPYFSDAGVYLIGDGIFYAVTEEGIAGISTR